MPSPLQEYDRKRRFDKTDEPPGSVATRNTGRLRFVVQHHIASRDHYDFRLEWDGVMKSWAVPKGPSYDSHDKRLAVQVEDHPLDYRTFEGTIPKGEYGGGTVMIWDQGTWQPIGDAGEEFASGSLKFILHGERLQGKWALVHMKPRPGEKDVNWLLIKERDEFEGVFDLGLLNTSVTTGRTMDQITEGLEPRKKAGKKAASSGGTVKEKRSGAGKTGAKTAAPAGRDADHAEDRTEPPAGAGASGARKTGTRTRATGKTASAAPPAKAAPKKASGQAAARAAKKTAPGRAESEVTISHPEKVVYKASGITKGDLADYYRKVADRMLPYLQNRVLSVVRCPGGVDGSCFYKKHPATDSRGVVPVPVTSSKGETGEYFYIPDASGLLWEVQMNTIEFHAWGSRVETMEQPDLMVFDLDPDEGMDPGRVREGVLDLKGLLDDLSLTSFLKTSGGKGYHVVVPFAPAAGWEVFQDFARNIAKTMEARWPDRYTSNVRKARRSNRIFIDWIRNGRGATSIVPFSVRAREGAPVSLPIAWKELSSVAPDGISMDEAVKRLRRKDPWAGFFEISQRLK